MFSFHKDKLDSYEIFIFFKYNAIFLWMFGKYNGHMKKYKNMILLLVILAVLLWGVISVVNLVRKVTNAVVEPADILSTRAAAIMNSTPTIIAQPQTIIHDVRSLARLETIQYTLEKVITAEISAGDLNFLFGDKLLFVAHGEVIAGIDLELLEEEDMTLSGGTLYVTLPQVEIFSYTLDNDKSFVYDRDTGLFSKGEVKLETLARQAAVEEIRKAALQDGILEMAQVNAENFLTSFFRSLGYSDVVLEFSEQE